MTCPAPLATLRRKFLSDSQPNPMIPPHPLHAPLADPVVASNPLERLAQLVIANDRLIDDLATSRARIVAALTYLDQDGCHARLGEAHLERCRTRHASILAQLRANRIEALNLLGRDEPVASEGR